MYHIVTGPTMAAHQWGHASEVMGCTVGVVGGRRRNSWYRCRLRPWKRGRDGRCRRSCNWRAQKSSSDAILQAMNSNMDTVTTILIISSRPYCQCPAVSRKRNRPTRTIAGCLTINVVSKMRPASSISVAKDSYMAAVFPIPLVPNNAKCHSPAIESETE